MLKIGQFSRLSKTTIKALRYYEKEKILIPTFIDDNGYRYYESKQLIELARIISLRQIGLSINEIKEYLNGTSLSKLLESKKQEIENNLKEQQYQLSMINYILEEKNVKYETIIKELPSYTVYYKEGIIKDYSEMTNFILSSGEECLKLNPGIKCIHPDYCYVNYLDGEYKDHDINIRYAQAVEAPGKEDENIKFMTLKPVNAVCIYHKGSYDKLGDAYAYIMKYIEDNKLEIIDCPRERYIDGMWNKEDVNDWLTEIQVPIKK